MKIEHDGETYEFDMDSVNAQELRLVEQHADMTFAEWQQGLQRGKVNALVALVFLAKRRAGSDVEWSDLDSLNIQDLLEAMAEVNGVDLDAVERGEVDVDALAASEMDKARQNREARRAARKTSRTTATAPAAKRPPARRAAAK
ncbi:hypothetical protein [Pseudonocardia parietis]|uniref:Tail assembly chaperone n=1 Tax=Pseudonocardia parietis TaxID=570936 RepID=A0ABS4W217_9PSEU|nr:hypothetical protein [Pseudonocardia parietis]MBP2370219.1 hypothetical protein [Pseudonocardia parietis]